MAMFYLAAAAMAVNCADPCAWSASAARVTCLAYSSYLGLYWPDVDYLGLALFCFAVIGLVWFALLKAL